MINMIIHFSSVLDHVIAQDNLRSVRVHEWDASNVLLSPTNACQCVPAHVSWAAGMHLDALERQQAR